MRWFLVAVLAAMSACAPRVQDDKADQNDTPWSEPFLNDGAQLAFVADADDLAMGMVIIQGGETRELRSPDDLASHARPIETEELARAWFWWIDHAVGLDGLPPGERLQWWPDSNFSSKPGIFGFFTPADAQRWKLEPLRRDGDRWLRDQPVLLDGHEVRLVRESLSVDGRYVATDVGRLETDDTGMRIEPKCGTGPDPKLRPHHWWNPTPSIH
jgi:hypothetical protein